MGKVSVTQVPQDGRGNGSREVFQGLFKDLGKQAMALEAILRAVCGRVDKMENWLTEISFGMTELDLKLRNIAHNIDGTAAVDDEAQGPHRWAIPPTDQVKPLALTVSKKLGTDKRAVRVTGLAAAILDRLATASSGSTPTAADSEKLEKAKKKSKDKRHNTKREKSTGSTEVQPGLLAAVAEVSSEVSGSKSVSPEQVKARRDEVAPVEAMISAPEPHPDGILTAVGHQSPISDEANKVSEISNDTESLARIYEPEHRGQNSLQNDDIEEETTAPSSELDQSNGDSTAASNESSPVVSSREAIEINTLVEEEPIPVETKAEVKMMQADATFPDIGSNAILPTKEKEGTNVAISAISTSVVSSSEPQPTPSSTAVAEIPVDVESTPSKLSTMTEQKADNKMPIPILSVSNILPTVQVERSPISFDLKSSAHTAPVTSTEPDSSLDSASNVLKHQMLPQASHTQPSASISEQQNVSNNNSHAIADSRPTTVQEHAAAVTKAIKASGVPIRVTTPQYEHKPLSPHDSSLPVDPLLPHRTASRRRSSKMAPRSSLTKKHEVGADTNPTRRFSEHNHGPHSRRPSMSPQSTSVEEDTPLSDHLTVSKQATHPISQPPAVSAIKNTIDQTKNVEIGSQESSSDSSSDGSESSSSDEEQDEDRDAGAGVDEISKTMTALKKLKRAQMLSPEEEKELKERAHKKWFQLKGHIKEKQKKDVTNILLRRKKNVFTVSSRIELLEEKSREIFAALKQMTSELREKNDRATHETLRRRVTDMEQSLLNIDSRIASLSAPATEKVNDLESELLSLRTTMQIQFITAQSEATTRHSLLEEALASQRALIESLTQDVPAQLSAQTELFLEKLKQQPDYTAAIENLRRILKRKADLKLLKELEARLLGLDAENEDCLVRCLSCRKEVTYPNEKEAEGDDQDVGTTGGGTSQVRKINPGPSSARIFRSNIPFNAQPFVQESIQEESSNELLFPPQQSLMQAQSSLFAREDPQPYQLQSAGDFHVSEKSEKPPGFRVPSGKWPTPAVDGSLKRDTKNPQASPLSLMNITATRAVLSPDRPISAPVVPSKKKPTTAVRSKSLLKSLTPQPDILPQ